MPSSTQYVSDSNRGLDFESFPEGSWSINNSCLAIIQDEREAFHNCDSQRVCVKLHPCMNAFSFTEQNKISKELKTRPEEFTCAVLTLCMTLLSFLQNLTH